MLTVRQLMPEDCERWDQFVASHPQGSPFHLTAWKKSIEDTFHYRSLYLIAETAGCIQGVLPLFLVKNFVVGKALLSSPFAVYGGVLADSVDAAIALCERTKSLGESLGAQYVELRNAHPEQCTGTSNVSRYVTFTKEVGPDERMILETLPKKTRNIVRKALRTPFSIRRQASNFLAFEALYTKNLRRLGTPSFPSRHFAALITNFGSLVDIREVVLDGQVVAASLNFYFRNQMHVYYAASDPRFNGLAPNTYMYFDHLRWAGQNGYRIFDFGRCKRDSGTFEFKRHWGGAMRELPYEIILINRRSLPNYSPVNPRFQLAIKLWRNLPLAATRALGPALVRLFP